MQARDKGMDKEEENYTFHPLTQTYHMEQFSREI